MTSAAPRTEPGGARERASGPAPLAGIPIWAEALVKLLDRAFVIPGTKIPVGLDAILGFVAPGAGDAASAIATASLFWVAHRARVPRVILLRMLVNVLVDALVGVVPLLGDVFDVAFRAGDKNLALIRRYAGTGRAPGAADYAVLGLALLVVVALIALPFAIGLAVVHAIVVFGGGN